MLMMRDFFALAMVTVVDWTWWLLVRIVGKFRGEVRERRDGESWRRRWRCSLGAGAFGERGMASPKCALSWTRRCAGRE